MNQRSDYVEFSFLTETVHLLDFTRSSQNLNKSCEMFKTFLTSFLLLPRVIYSASA